VSHTPGPWSLGRSADSTPLVVVPVHESEGTGFGVAQVNRIPRMSGVRGDMEANARLIAAAPELLQAAEEALALLSKGAPGWGVAKDLLNAAIKKARGG
jgi:hypothetical protein